jgi:hypothetical protein
MQELLKRIQELLQRRLDNAGGNQSHLDPAQRARMERLLNLLCITQTEELGCEEAYELLDKYADLDLTGEEVDLLLPLVKHHLDLCQECCDEYHMLLQSLRANAEARATS